MDDLRERKRRALLHPEDPEALHALAEALFTGGDVAEARRQVEKALERHPAHANLVHLGVASCLRESRQERARELLEAAVAAAPGAAAFRDALADLLDESRPDDALVERLIADGVAPGDEGRRMAIAVGFARRGLALRALRTLAPLLAGGHAEAQQLSATLRERFPGLGLDLADRALACAPAGALRDAAQRLLAGDTAGARRALALAPAAERDAQAYVLLRAALLRRAGRDAEAATALARAGISDAPVGALVPEHAAVGQIGALGWGPGSGCVSPVQAAALPGEARLHFSGNVKQVGREAGDVAWTCLRALAGPLGFGEALRGKDLHLHWVDTEVTKDGPSAGVALWLAGASAITGRPLHGRLAATGELTLQGAVRPVGGLHEKCTAAWLAGVARLIAPRPNRPEIEELPPAVRRGLEVTYVDDAAQALAAALASDLPREHR